MAQSNHGTVNSKTGQQVVFVDEEGNPIEPGTENVLYVDVNGYEISESLAQEYLHSGEYVDARELYQFNDTSSVRSQSRQSNRSASNRSASNISYHQPTPRPEVFSQQSESRRQQLPPPQKRSQSIISKSGSTITNGTYASEALPTNSQFSQHVYELQNLIHEQKSIHELRQSNTGSKINHTPLPPRQYSASSTRHSSITPIRQQSATPIRTQSSTPMRHQSSTPMRQQSSTPMRQQAYTPMTQQSYTPVTEQSHTPTTHHSHTPMTQKSHTPVTQQSYTPVTQQSYTPVTQQSYTPVTHQSNGTPTRQYTATPSDITARHTSSSRSNYTPQIPKLPTQISITNVPNGYYAQKVDQVGQLNIQTLITNDNAHATLDLQHLDKLAQIHEQQQQKQTSSFASSSKSGDRQQQQQQQGETPNFPDTNLADLKYDTFIDPFTSDLFKDEIIDIDYGAIDAFTNTLNAQFEQEVLDHAAKNNGQINKQYQSHIINGNYGSFIENQLLLGDSTVNASNDPGMDYTSFAEFDKQYKQKNGISANIIDVYAKNSNSSCNNYVSPTSLVIENVPSELVGHISLDDLNAALVQVLVLKDLPGDNKSKIINQLQSTLKTKQSAGTFAY